MARRALLRQSSTVYVSAFTVGQMIAFVIVFEFLLAQRRHVRLSAYNCYCVCVRSILPSFIFTFVVCLLAQRRHVRLSAYSCHCVRFRSVFALLPFCMVQFMVASLRATASPGVIQFSSCWQRPLGGGYSWHHYSHVAVCVL